MLKGHLCKATPASTSCDMEEVESEGTKKGRGLFFRVRVAILLTILAGVLLYAWNDVRKRHARNEWKRPLVVAFVVVREGPVSDASVERLRARVPFLEQRLAEEMARYRETTAPPFQFQVLGPIDGPPPPPAAPAESGIIDSAKYQWALHKWTSEVDSTGAYPSKGYDTRIYLYATPPAQSGRAEIEGLSEDGGTVGVVRVELDESMADFTLFVATHETLHTLGATDKYAADGSVLVPDGLPEPDHTPLYPQRFAEIMARHRAVSPSATKPPTSLAQLALGLKTAHEIGWH